MSDVTAQPVPTLEAERGPLAGRRIAVQPLPFAIGRAPANQLVIPDTSVSRSHARLDVHEAHVVLQDLDSANGTLLNRLPLRGTQTLHDGDLITIGESTFLFVATPPKLAGATRPHRSVSTRSPLPTLAGLLLIFAATLLIGLQIGNGATTAAQAQATPPALTLPTGLPALPSGLPPLPTGLPALPTGLPDLFPLPTGLPALPGFPPGGQP